MCSQTASASHTRKGDLRRQIVHISFLLGFGTSRVVSAGGRRQAACALRSVCVEALSRELTGVTGQGDTWPQPPSSGPPHAGSVEIPATEAPFLSAHPPSFQGLGPKPLPFSCLSARPQGVVHGPAAVPQGTASAGEEGRESDLGTFSIGPPETSVTRKPH